MVEESLIRNLADGDVSSECPRSLSSTILPPYFQGIPKHHRASFSAGFYPSKTKNETFDMSYIAKGFLALRFPHKFVEYLGKDSKGRKGPGCKLCFTYPYLHQPF